MPSSRTKAVTEAAVDAWLAKVTAKFAELGLNELTPEELSERLWNCDETAFATDVASQKILARKDTKNVHETGGGSGREYITVLGCGSASGIRLPSYTVYKRKNKWSNWMVGGPAGTLYNTSQSGWMEQHHFLEWFKKLFLPAIANLLENGSVVLFVDGHISHVSIELIQLARERGVVLFCPPITHNACSPAPRFCSIWTSEEELEKNFEGVQNGDMCSKGGQNSLSQSSTKALGGIFSTRTP